MVKCGLCEINITPPLGATIPGQWEVKKASGIKDELYAKALVIDDGEKTVVFVTLDALVIESNDVRNIRARVYETAGIPESNIMVSATHTHTGPPVADTYYSKRDNGYVDYMVKKAADAAVIAFKNRKPACIGFGTGTEKDIAFNRRRFIDTISPIDPEVTVMRIDDAEGHPMGVVTNFACHLDVVGGTEYSADYAGELSLMLKRLLGQDIVSLFFTGACGNINHIDTDQEVLKDLQYYKKMGRILAGEVYKIREKIQVVSGLKVDAEQSVFNVVMRKPDTDDVREAEKIMRSSIDLVEKGLAEELIKVYKNEKDTKEVEIHVIKVGELAISGFPGEMFVEFGLSVKNKSPFSYNMVNELANGSCGYVPVKEAFEQGGYETSLTSITNLMPGAGCIFVEKVSELQEKLFKE